MQSTSGKVRSNFGSVQSNSGSAPSRSAMARNRSAMVQSTNATEPSSCRRARSTSGRVADRSDRRRSSTAGGCCSSGSSSAMAAGTSGCHQTADCCYSWVKSDANRNSPTADDPSWWREPSGLRHSMADRPTRCRIPAERGHGRWHCLEPSKCAFRSVGDWPMRRHFHSLMRGC